MNLKDLNEKDGVIKHYLKLDTLFKERHEQVCILNHQFIF